MKRKLISVLLILILVISGCTSKAKGNDDLNLNDMTLEEITEKAKKEGEIQSVGMPDGWANWKETWQDIEKIYSIAHEDTDMSSSEEIAMFEKEKNNPTKDIGDVGQAHGPYAKQKGLTLKYKTSYWDSIPDWAKDEDGDWIVGYYGTISFLTNKKKVKDVPKSWEDILNGTYKVSIGDVNSATQAQNAVLAAAIANGGDENSIEKGLDLFKKLAEQGRLDLGDNSLSRLEAGEIEVGVYWDFNALNYSNKIERENPNAKFEVTIPKDGSIQSGYATIINKYAPHPHAAALAREYILSEEGQINLAKGYARPIRKDIDLPEDVGNLLVDEDQYVNATNIKDTKKWDEVVENLGRMWQEDVLSYVK